MKRRSLAALKRAVRIAGTQTELALRISKILRRPIKQGHIWSWLNREGRVPAWAVLATETAVDGEVSRHELRIDLYPRD